ncbi:DUF4329 domain-containing protein [Cochlodiniinecator piscidefendens]|uniref:DUF4329 domain-containing protein n=1 Tax=Cochlodiniinecator piscidefendens TaxID=2715756 RepID=UPI001E37845F|nr:DUF4329 domain-containing protein [Cochlodiniinecator piscidefendens]
MKRLYLTILMAALPLTANAQSTREAQFAQSVLNNLQQQSFQRNREFCGYIGFDNAGQLIATPATMGRPDSCEPPEPYNMLVVASYHTHGAFDPDALAEFPSADDMEADEAEGIDGYVATPGGRLWYIDSTDMEASQLCGIGCLAKDPNFIAGLDGHIQQSYRYSDLVRILNQ